MIYAMPRPAEGGTKSHARLNGPAEGVYSTEALVAEGQNRLEAVALVDLVKGLRLGRVHLRQGTLLDVVPGLWREVGGRGHKSQYLLLLRYQTTRNAGLKGRTVGFPRRSQITSPWRARRVRSVERGGDRSAGLMSHAAVQS